MIVLKYLNSTMKNIFCFLVTLTIIFSCTNVNDKNSKDKNTLKKETNKVSVDSINISNTIPKNVIPDFLILSQEATEESFGNLQGVKMSDSAGPYMMRDYVNDSISFTLIFYPKSVEKGKVDFSQIKMKYMQNNYKDFYCFAFVFPFPDPEKVKDYHADNTPYPINVKSYFRQKGSWNFISSRVAKNLTELSTYEIEVMYSNLK